MIKVDVKPLGPYVIDEHHQLNTFYIQTNQFHILYDVIPIQNYDQFLNEMRQHCEINDLDFIVISNMHLSTLYVIEALMKDGFTGAIISNHFFTRQINNAYPELKIQSIQTLNYQFLDEEQLIFEFLPVVFMPYPKMFLTYIPSQYILLSNTLFSSYSHLGDQKHPWMGFEQFHENMLPSSHFIKVPFQMIKDKRIDTIYPLYGKTYHLSQIKDVFSKLMDLQFFNQSKPYEEQGGLKRVYDFSDAINDMQAHLKKHIPIDELIVCFDQSKFNFDHKTLAFVSSEYAGFVLWNSYFEHIYMKKGILWLSILEKIVKKYVNDYQMSMPAIYESEAVKLELQAKHLFVEKNELEKRIESLNEAIIESKDLSVKSKTTGLYIQSVLKEMIKKRLVEHDDKYHFGLMLIQLDQLNDLNHQYGKKAGDEALRTLAYTIEQLKDESCLMFRQSGPGVIIYKHDATIEDLKQAAIIIKNHIQSSVLFIDKVTVSISIVTSDEMDQTLNDDQNIQKLFELLEKRMLIAKRKGYGEIITKDDEQLSFLEGMILIVDEDPLSQNMMIRIFHRIDYEVVVASSVTEAMKILIEKPIDVVISEINLSKLDGFELKRLMNESIYRNTPFIMVSHNKTVENIKRGNTLSVDYILEKPIVMDEIIGIVKRFKERKLSL